MRDLGPGVAGRLLRDALARPHAVVVAPDTGIVLGRGTDVPTTLLVIGGPARLEGHVRGDFIVLGDVVLRPGARIDGRAIAFGGVVLNSTLATVAGERLAFPDVGFRATPTGGETYALDYELLEHHPVPRFSLPGLFGVQIPTYDRIDGLSAGVGPEIALDTGRLRIDPALTYRSHLGTLDPSATATWELGRRTALEARAGRGTFTNDAWMRSDLVNTATALFAGSDARNYYRADRAELTGTRRFETTSSVIAPFVGALVERSWSAARDSLASSAPRSFLARHDREEGMLRPNPAVTGGSIASALLGVRAEVLNGPVTAHGLLRAELPLATPDDRRFAQLTVDGQVSFPAFRDHTFDALGHFVLTAGDSTPSQRYAYVGGGPTIPTLLLLEQGGDRLVWLESRYTVPVNAVKLPFVGSPKVALRHVVGGAGVGRLPALTQNLGLRLILAVVRVDFVIDPAKPSRHELGVSLSAP
ncbi:hypothetical protein J421_3260 [Gemmatirosa kalamazoonensis]|uniref:Bacterial surface antigen (D15) domain-containing protein n=1 Tax=Gemmatirosa kalamazoonensis TaxID=861299 RepID=W0RK41_9BACT|nr:hypothetical protein [Gemmatirosa kalamazoonensis]AHG90797.1 hypothetical protein J421_3260 [Gemmatirosa kalamazoonensis]